MSEPIAEGSTTLELTANDNPKCPYCLHSDDDFHSDGLEFPTEDGAEMWHDCPNCSEKYQIVGHISVDFTTYKREAPDRTCQRCQGTVIGGPDRKCGDCAGRGWHLPSPEDEA